MVVLIPMDRRCWSLMTCIRALNKFTGFPCSRNPLCCGVLRTSSDGLQSPVFTDCDCGYTPPTPFP